MIREARVTSGRTGRPLKVGFVSSPHPHSVFHMKTLEVLEEVEEIHLCGIESEDLDALAAVSTKVRSRTEDLSQLLERPNLDAVLVCVRNDLCPVVLEATVAAGRSSDLFGRSRARTDRVAHGDRFSANGGRRNGQRRQ